jgi:hypothetical protein
MASIQNVLNLDSLTPSTVVRIGGRALPMRTMELMPPIYRHRVTKFASRMDALELQPELNEDEAAELEALPGKLVGLILNMDDDAIEALKLSPDQRMQVIAAFLQPSRANWEAETAPANSPIRTGDTSSPA